jgi:bacitracin synthase 3
MPLNSNGKIDRKTLPEPKLKNQDEQTTPRDEVEEKLVVLWVEILNLDSKKIGIHADFFEWGGDSLKATILVTKIHQELRVKISITDIFKLRTISELSDHIRKTNPRVLISIKATEKREYYHLSPAQKRFYYLSRFNELTTSYNTPHFFELRGQLDGKRLEKSFIQLIKRHESLRTSFVLVDGEPAQKIHHNVPFEVQHYQLGFNAGQKEEKVNKIITHLICPFDLARAPLMRAGLIKTGKAAHILAVDMHHIICDGTATGILANEFSTFYNGEKLPPLRIQYHDFSEWWQQKSRSRELDQQAEYWHNTFKDPAPVLNLPTDYPRPQVMGIEGDTFIFSLHPEQVKKIRQIMKETKTTLFMVTLAIYNVLLMKYTGKNDIVVGTGIAGRGHADLLHIVGLFANMLAMRNYPHPEETFLQFLENVQKNTLKTFENQDFQFDQLIEKLKLPITPSRNPLFDTVFQVQNVELKKSPVRALELKPGEYNQKISHYDLLVVAVEEVDKITISINYSTMLFKKETVEKIAEHYLQILDQVMTNKMKKLKDIFLSNDLIEIKSDFLDDNQEDFEF